MKFIGLFIAFISLYGLQEQFTLDSLVWFGIGIALMFFDVIVHLIKMEISARSYRRRW